MAAVGAGCRVGVAARVGVAVGYGDVWHAAMPAVASNATIIDAIRLFVSIADITGLSCPAWSGKATNATRPYLSACFVVPFLGNELLRIFVDEGLDEFVGFKIALARP